MEKIIYYSKAGNVEEEFSYDIDYWKQYLKDYEIKSIELVEMEFDKLESLRFCTLEREFIESGYCGKENCGSDYIPQNGVRGKCVYKSFTLKETKNIIILKDKL